MEKVLNFARLVYDISSREIKGETAKNKVIEFLDSLEAPTEEELNLFNDIIRKQDFSILNKNVENAPWRILTEELYATDNYVLKTFTYYILTKKFYGDEDSEMDYLLSDIYAEEKAKGPGSELDRMDTIVWHWVKAIVNHVFPFTESVFTYDSDEELSLEERAKANAFISLVRLAYADVDDMDNIDHMLIKILSNPAAPLFGNYNWDRLAEFVRIAKEGGYTQLAKAYGSTNSNENILLYWINAYTLYDLSKEEKENLKLFTNNMQSMFGIKGDSPFDAFASKMMD